MVSQAALSTLSFAQADESLPTMTDAQVKDYDGEEMALGSYTASNGVTFHVGDALALSPPEDMVYTWKTRRKKETCYLHIQRLAFPWSRPATHNMLGKTLVIEEIQLFKFDNCKEEQIGCWNVNFISSKDKYSIAVNVELALENNDFSLLNGQSAE